ncbi:MAG: cob(I)yrinic acid a,c-diamide adenosyltransferase, partial [Dolichospermum sp.]
MKSDTPEELNSDQEISRLIDQVISSSQTDEKYRQKMQRRKEIQDQRIAKAIPEKGLIIVNTGHGKGKT